MAERKSFFIDDMNHIDAILETFPIGEHDVRAVSFRANEGSSAPTEITQYTHIMVYAASITANNIILSRTVTRVLHGHTTTIGITPALGYKVPTTAPTVIGANSVYTRIDDGHATLSISEPTGAVSCTINGESLPNYLAFVPSKDTEIGWLVEYRAGSPVIPNLSYSFNGYDWNNWTLDSYISIPQNTKMYLRGNNETFNYYEYVEDTNGDNELLTHFYCEDEDAAIAVSGNIMSLLDPTCARVNITGAYCFQGLFSYFNLTSAPELPATTLSEGCYAYIFESCKSLVNMPSLPAVTLAQYCYANMFSNCTALTVVSALSATVLAIDCYSGMFKKCSSLVNAPQLPATTLAQGCYESMFRHCIALTGAPELPATTLVGSCYSAMFRGCKALVSAPALPATTLAEECYTQMFLDCTHLTTIPLFAATTVASHSCAWMFEGCTSLTTAPALAATSLAYACYEGMFTDCESLLTAPNLPATTLAQSCYHSMFSGCTNINVQDVVNKLTAHIDFTSLTAPQGLQGIFAGLAITDNMLLNILGSSYMLPAMTLTEGCYDSMFYNCSSLTTAPTLPATTLASDCYASMFQGCTNLSEISVYFVEWSDSTNSWLDGVASTGTFKCAANLPDYRGISNIPSNWTKASLPYAITNTLSYIEPDEDNPTYIHPFVGTATLTYHTTASYASMPESVTVTGADYVYTRISDTTCTIELSNPTSVINVTITAIVEEPDYFYAEALYGATEFAWQYGWSESATTFNIEYKINDGEWTTYTPTFCSTTPNRIKVNNTGDKVYFRGLNATLSTSDCQLYLDSPNYGYRKHFKIGGDLTTLLNQVGRVNDLTPYGSYVFYCMFGFNSATYIEDASELILPSMILTPYCYAEMFNSCSYLIQGPKVLPALNVPEYAYLKMLWHSDVLVESPDIRATNIGSGGFQFMFYDSSLVSSIKTHFTTWPTNGTNSWVDGVAATGTFYAEDSLPREYGTNKIPTGWTVRGYYHTLINNLNAYVTADASNPSQIAYGGTATLHYTSNTYEINSVSLTNCEYTTTYASNYDVTITITNPTNDITISINVNSPSVQIDCALTPVSSATVTGTGLYNIGSTATLTAIPAAGYQFSKWMRNGTEYTTNPLSFVVTQAETVVLGMIEVTSFYRIEDVSGASYNFALNANDYYESTNQNQNNSAALCKVIFNAAGQNMYLDCINYGENNYDFGLISKLDTALSTSSSIDGSSLVLKSFQSESSPEVVPVLITNDSAEHFIYVKYRKDVSVGSNNDSLQFKVRFE